MFSKRFLILLFALLLLLPATVALAHTPVFVPDTNHSWQSALVIPNHQISWAIYGRLAAPKQVDFFAFEGQAGESAYLKVDIPLIEGLANFRPSMALVGPGLSTNNLSALPISLPAGSGAIIIPDNGRTDSFYERHSDTSYWERQELRLNLPATGRYYVLLWSPEIMVGKYLLVMGRIERRMASPGVAGNFRDFFAHPVGRDVPYPAGVPLATETESSEPSCLFFTETTGGQGGYSVCDDASANFRTAFEGWGLEKIGYPISRRYRRGGFTTQAFQKAIMQWRPESDSVALVNIFDELHQADFDETLLRNRQVPKSLPAGWDGGIGFDQVVQKRQQLLNARPALRRAYFASSNPLTFYGLPTSQVQDMGSHYAIRLQRAVLQEWKQDVPWARAGQVTIANGGDIAKELGALPSGALRPEAGR